VINVFWDSMTTFNITLSDMIENPTLHLILLLNLQIQCETRNTFKKPSEKTFFNEILDTNQRDIGHEIYIYKWVNCREFVYYILLHANKLKVNNEKIFFNLTWTLCFRYWDISVFTLADVWSICVQTGGVRITVVGCVWTTFVHIKFTIRPIPTSFTRAWTICCITMFSILSSTCTVIGTV